MITIAPDEAQQHIDCAFVMTSLAEIHTVWGEAAWNRGDYPGAIRQWRTAAGYRITAQQEGGDPR